MWLTRKGTSSAQIFKSKSKGRIWVGYEKVKGNFEWKNLRMWKHNEKCTEIGHDGWAGKLKN